MSQLTKVGFLTVAGGEQFLTVSSLVAYGKMCEAQERSFLCFITSVWSLARCVLY